MTAARVTVLRSHLFRPKRAAFSRERAAHRAESRQKCWFEILAESSLLYLLGNIRLENNRCGGVIHTTAVEKNVVDYFTFDRLFTRSTNMNGIKRELKANYSFSEVDKNKTYEFLSSIDCNPYHDFKSFANEIYDKLKKTSLLPDSFIKIVKEYRNSSGTADPVIFIENCPIDIDLPVFDYDNPLQSKYDLKKTFIAEGFLTLYACISGQMPIGYSNINNGDVFQKDIYPMRKLAKSQSQKALGPLYFHGDLINHFVRPDWINMLAMRSNSRNECYTTFSFNKDVLSHLSSDVIENLARHEFHTPKDCSKKSVDNAKLSNVKAHPILSDQLNIGFLENRTFGLTDRAKLAVEALIHSLHKNKKCVQMIKGDFIGMCNNLLLHGREVREIGDVEALKQRWTMKSANVSSIAAHSKHLVPGSSYMING